MERELYVVMYRLARQLDKLWGSWLYSTSDVVAIYFWAVIHDRPTVWAVDPDNWPDDLQPQWIPSQSTMSNRLRQSAAVDLMTKVEQHLWTLLSLGKVLIQRIDGKPLTISRVSRDPDAGYGPAAGGMAKGYKLYAVWGKGPMPAVWGLAPMNVSEKYMARGLIPELPDGHFLIGDTIYDANDLYDLAEKAGYQLLAKTTPSRGKGKLGHRRQAPGRLRSIDLQKTAFGQELLRNRNEIEARFGTLTSFGGGLAPLPAWVRRLSRVRNWVQTKIIIAGTRWLILRTPQKLAFE